MIEMVDVFGIVISGEAILLLGAYTFFTLVIIYFYRFSNKRLMKRIKELKNKEREIYKLIEKINKVRQREHRDVNKRLSEMEERVDFLMKPDTPEKELERERMMI